MKSGIKNIIIIAEFVLIAVLAVISCLAWTSKEKSVPASTQNTSLPEETTENETDIDRESIKERVSQNFYELSGKKITMEDSTYGEIWLPVLENVPEFSKDKELIKTRNGRKYYVEDNQIDSILGIDVSVHQDDIDWEAVSASGIEFAMIRLGFRGYGTGEAHLDDNYRQNIEGARAAGIDAGVYFFSQAITVDEALEEAQLVIDALEGLDINYPVVYDWEIIYDDTARTDNISVDTLTDCCVAFCEAVKDAGYTPMVYQNKRTTMFKLDLERLGDYDFWLAEYNDEPTYYYDFTMWQYTSQGRVPGIEGDVDLNISFKDYSE